MAQEPTWIGDRPTVTTGVLAGLLLPRGAGGSRADIGTAAASSRLGVHLRLVILITFTITHSTATDLDMAIGLGIHQAWPQGEPGLATQAIP